VLPSQHRPIIAVTGLIPAFFVKTKKKSLKRIPQKQKTRFDLSQMPWLLNGNLQNRKSTSAQMKQ